MNNVFFISDLHLGHKNITKYRPEFDSIEEHDQTIITNILSVSCRRSILWILGDCFFDEKWEPFAHQLFDRWGSVNLVLGNHDTEKSERMKMIKRLIMRNNVNVHGITSKYKAWVSHCPIHPDEMRGKVANIHGHTHGKNIQDDRYINVSCEQVNYKPIDLNEIRSIMESRNLLGEAPMKEDKDKISTELPKEELDASEANTRESEEDVPESNSKPFKAQFGNFV